MKNDVPHLLLVEEDELLSDITAFRLELLGYQVTCVRAGKTAQELLGHDPLPDLLIINTQLPDMNGFDLINKLNASERTTNTAIMALSNDADLNTVQRAYRAGAKDYLVLPYDPAVLEQKVDRLLQKSAAAAKEKAVKDKKAAAAAAAAN